MASNAIYQDKAGRGDFFEGRGLQRGPPFEPRPRGLELRAQPEQRRLVAGWPVRLNHTVNGEKWKTRRQYSSKSSSIMSIQPSLGGNVARPGVSNTS